MGGEILVSRNNEPEEIIEDSPEQVVSREKSIGEYVLDKKVGEGNSATIWTAHKKDIPEETIALKRLHSSLEDDVEQFRREAAALIKLNKGVQHPNLVKLLDIGIHKDKPYIAMEHVKGNDLETVLNGYQSIQSGSKKQFMPLKKAADILLQIAKAIQASHENGVIHRDIKPRNVLISENDIVKVADFGLSRVKSSELKHSLSFSENNPEIVGTMEYMSPNQKKGGKSVPQDDLYSFGILLYKTLTNSFPSDTHFRSLPSDINNSLPGHVDSIFNRCLGLNSETQYASAQELISDIQWVQDNVDVLDSSSIPSLTQNTKSNIWNYCLGSDGIHERFLQLQKELQAIGRYKQLLYWSDDKLKINSKNSSRAVKLNISKTCMDIYVLEKRTFYPLWGDMKVTKLCDWFQIRFAKDPVYEPKKEEVQRKLFGKSKILGLSLGKKTIQYQKKVGEKDTFQYSWIVEKNTATPEHIQLQGSPDFFFNNLIRRFYHNQGNTLQVLRVLHEVPDLIRNYFAELNELSKNIGS